MPNACSFILTWILTRGSTVSLVVLPVLACSQAALLCVSAKNNLFYLHKGSAVTWPWKLRLGLSEFRRKSPLYSLGHILAGCTMSSTTDLADIPRWPLFLHSFMTLPTNFLFLFFFFFAALLSLWGLSSLTRDWIWSMAVKAISPNHWTAKELPNFLFLEGNSRYPGTPGTLLSLFPGDLQISAATWLFSYKARYVLSF